MGRPTTYTREIGDRICELIAGGENMHAACEIAGVPHRAFRNWKDANHDGFGDRVNKVYKDHYANSVSDRIKNKILDQQTISRRALEAALAASMHENPTWSIIEHRAYARAEASWAMEIYSIDDKLLEKEVKWQMFELPRRFPEQFGDKASLQVAGKEGQQTFILTVEK